jgi:MATE family multidrug resistance protein
MPYWYRRVFLLAIPLILSNLTQPLLSTVDTILSGHLPGPAALGGVALGGIFFNSIYWTFGFLRMATTGLVAQSHGAEDEDQVTHHFGRAFLTALLIGVVILLVQTPLISLALHLLGASPEARANAQVYCSIRIWSAPASLANYTILGYLLGRQRARTALALQAVINVVNVLVALGLVLGLHWGVAGIATATLCAEWAGCLLGLGIMLTSGVHPRHVRWSELMHGPSLRHLFALNRDILLRTLSLVAAYAWFTRSGAKMGDAILAANAVLLNFHMIAAYGLDGFANATEALVGQAIGANRREDYRSILKASFAAAGAVSVILSLIYWILGTRMIAIFTNQEPIRELAARFLPWIVAMPVVSVWNFQLDGVFVGATRAPDLRDSMLISFLGFLGLAVVLQARFGDNGLWCAMLGFMALRAVTLGIRLPRIETKAFRPEKVALAVTPVS